MNKKVIYSLIALALVFFITSLLIFIKSGKKTESDTPQLVKKQVEVEEQEPATINVKAFFVEGSSIMRPVPQEIELTGIKEEYYRQFLQLLIDGQDGFITPFPEGVTIRSIYLIENQAMLVIDFSENLIHLFPGGSTSELEFIYFFVDNICFNFKEIKKVKLMVAGNEYHTLSGHIDIENPFIPTSGTLRIEEKIRNPNIEFPYSGILQILFLISSFVSSR